MKQEAKKKSKLWLWLIIGLLILALLAGGAAAIIGLLGSGGKKAPGGRPELYWNVDREAYTNSETGLSTREPGEDGTYRVRFAINGDLVELPVADKQLVNYIDMLNAMGLVMDNDGTVVDVMDPKDIATEVNKNAYVKNVDGDTIIANTSLAMNGMNLNLKLEDVTEIYDVSPEAEVPGQIIQASDLKPMDTLCIYANDLEQVTHIYMTSHGKESKVYWRANQQYNSTMKATKREPDENGVYSVDFFCEGERVTLKTKDKAIVNKIDAASRWKCHFGFAFDEEGYITECFDSAQGICGLLAADGWDVVAMEGDNITLQRLTTNDGSTWSGTIPDDCVIYDASYAALSEGRQGKQVDSLIMGDRVCMWTDTNGTPVLIYIGNRLVDSPAYWVTARKYNSTKQETTREPNANGYYEVELFKEGTNKTEIYYIKDKATMSYLDSISARCVGLKVGEGNVVEYVYHNECLTGYVVRTDGGYVSAVTGSIFTKISYGKRGSEVNYVLDPDARVYNVSTYGQYGEKTTIRVGDQIYAYAQPTGEIVLAFVMKRQTGANSLYYNLQRLYDSETKTTTREPDADGWYVFTMAHNGKQVTLRTRSKKIATDVDSNSPGAVVLDISGDVILGAYDPTYAYAGRKVASGYRYRYTDSKGVYHTVYNGDASKKAEFTMAEDCKIYNVSPYYKDFKGERIYSLKYNDMLTVYTNMYGEAAVVYVRQRDVDNMYWKTEVLYDSTNKVTKRKPDADGYYWYDLAVNGEVKTFKTKDQSIANSMDSYTGAFGLNIIGENEINGFAATSYVKDVKGNGVNGYCVTAINGRKVTLTYNKPGANFGKTETITLSSNAKIYDVTPDSPTFGAAIKLKVGDTVRTYLSRDEKTHNYVYVMARSTRKGGEVGYCEACKKEVTWNPLIGHTGIVKADGHWYVTQDMTSYIQQTFATAGKDFTICLDLNGHTLTRSDNGRMFRVSEGETLNIMDSVGGGKIVSSGAQGALGGVILMGNSGKVNMYGGTLEFVQGQYQNGSGGNIYLADGAEFNLYDGVITGGICESVSKAKRGYGGNVYLTGGSTFNMYGGTVKDGKVIGGIVETTDENGKVTYTTYTSHGGNFYLTSGSHLNIYGGEVTGGVAEAVSKKVDNGNGSTTTKTAVAYGGNIYSESKTNSLFVGKATISNGHATRGGNFYGRGSKILDGATIIDGTALQRGGNIVHTGESFIMDGNTQILNGVVGSVEEASAGYGGNISTHGGEITIKNATVDGGKAIYNGLGGNIYLYKGATDPTVLNIEEGALIQNGVATRHGGNIYQGNFDYTDENGIGLLSAVNMTGGQVLNGKCDTAGSGTYLGGNIYSNGHMSLTGGIISGGLQGSNDYDIHINGATSTTKPSYANVTVGDVVVEGKFCVGGPKEFHLVGAPKLGQLSFYKDVKAIVGELTENADIAVVTDAASPIFTTAFDNAQNYINAKYFKAYDVDGEVQVTAQSELKLVGSGASIDPNSIYNIAKAMKFESTEADGKVTAKCPVCNKEVDWYPMPVVDTVTGDENKRKLILTAEHNHYYLSEDIDYTQNTGYYSVSNNTQLCLHLNNQDLVSAHRALYCEGTTSFVNIMGDGSMTGYGYSASGSDRAAFDCTTAVNLYGGTYVSANDYPVFGVRSNGNPSCVLSVYEGTTVQTTNDCALYVNNKSAIRVCGGSVLDGSIIIDSANAALSIEGSPVIEKLDLMNGYKVTVGELTTGAHIIVFADGVFTNALTDANAVEGFFESGVPGKVVVSDGSTLAIANPPTVPEKTIYEMAKEMKFESTETDGKVTAKCPVCDEVVDWYPMPVVDTVTGDENKRKLTLTAEHNHYYLSEDIDYTQNTGYYSVSNNTQLCLHLNNQDVVSAHRALYCEGSTSFVNIMGDGSMTGYGYSASGSDRAAFDCTTAVNLYGGTYASANDYPVFGVRSGTNTNCVLSIYDGTTVQTTNDCALYVTKKSGIKVCGGSVLGGSIINDSAEATVYLEGAPVIEKLDVTNGIKVTVGELTTGADITVVADGVFTNTIDANAATYAKYFHVDALKKGVVAKDNALMVTDVCPHCGVALTDITWTDLGALKTGHKFTSSGHYRLTEEINSTSGNVFAFDAATSATTGLDVVLDTRGFNVNSKARVAIVKDYNKFTIFDSVGGTVATSASTNTKLGGSGMSVNTGAEVNIYDITLNGSAGTHGNGNCISVYNTTAKVNIYSGTFNGNADTQADKRGGVIYNNGILNIYGGTFGAAELANGLGGTLYSCGSLNVSGGTFAGDVYINGGNAVLSGDVEMAELELVNGTKVTLEELTENADITVIAEGEFTVANDKAQSYVDAGYVKPSAGNKITVTDGVMSMSAVSLLKSIAAFLNVLCTSVI